MRSSSVSCATKPPGTNPGSTTSISPATRARSITSRDARTVPSATMVGRNVPASTPVSCTNIAVCLRAPSRSALGSLVKIQ